MPLIERRGAASARGFGLFAAGATCCLNDGNKGIFALGCVGGGVTTRNKYTYASCSSTASGVGAASAASYQGSAAGNNTRGIFQLGLTTSACCGTVRNKYTYASCSSTASGVASASSPCVACGSAAAGNTTRGIFTAYGLFAGACAFRDKYTYACCTSTTSGVAKAATGSQGLSATGNSTKGIFARGGTYSFALCTIVVNTTREKYTYACCTSTASGVGAASTASGYGTAAAGNSTRGIFALGYTANGPSVGTTTRNKYTYACCTSTATGVGSASVNSVFGSATGNSTRGIFAIGFGNCASSTSTRNKYTYACCTSTATGVGTASSASERGSAASWAACVNT